MTDRPYFSEIWLACGQCSHEWDDWQPCRVPVETWIAHAQTFRCPKCGADKGIKIRSSPMAAA